MLTELVILVVLGIYATLRSLLLSNHCCVEPFAHIADMDCCLATVKMKLQRMPWVCTRTS